MQTARPRLLEFSLSHFCEKARWALDHHGIGYDVVALAPGLHRLALRRVGAKASWVPVLVADGATVQGSDAIIDWADARDPARSLTPSDPTAAAEARRLEHVFDDGFGRDLRAVLYAMLLEQPDVVIALWAAGQPWWVGTFYRLFWSQVSLGLRKLYRLRPERVAEARVRFDATFDELDALVADGRRYLVGDTLSRADLAAAALLSPLVVPAERPWQPNVPLTADVIAMQHAYRSRPGWAWVEGLYRGDRLAGR